MTAALEVVSGQQHATAALDPGKDPVPILQEAGWAPGPVWMGGKSRPHRDLIPDRPARSQSLYRLRYRAHRRIYYGMIILALLISLRNDTVSAEDAIIQSGQKDC